MPPAKPPVPEPAREPPPAARQVVLSVRHRGGWLAGLLAAGMLLVAGLLLVVFSVAFLFVLIPVALAVLGFALWTASRARPGERPRDPRVLEGDFEPAEPPRPEPGDQPRRRGGGPE